MSIKDWEYMHLRTIFSSYTVCHLSNIQQQYQLQLLHGLLSHLQEVVQLWRKWRNSKTNPKVPIKTQGGTISALQFDWSRACHFVTWNRNSIGYFTQCYNNQIWRQIFNKETQAPQHTTGKNNLENNAAENILNRNSFGSLDVYSS